MDGQSEASTGFLPAGFGDLPRRGGIALVCSVVVNIAIVTVTEFTQIAPHLEPLSDGPVVLFTTIGVVGATLVYAILERVSGNPEQLFTVVATISLLVSIIPDITYITTLPGATTLGAAALALTHVTTAVICVTVLTGRVF